MPVRVIDPLRPRNSIVIAGGILKRMGVETPRTLVL
jgi:hypothetical protein